MLAQTFVDPADYRAPSYLASGWSRLRQTKGYARVPEPQYYQDNDRPKHLWVKPLTKDALERLLDPSRLLDGEDPKKRVPGTMPGKSKTADSLDRALRSVKDPRSSRGRQFPLSAMLVAAVPAKCCGESTVTGTFRFCQELSWPQRAKLGFRSTPKARKIVPPPSEGCWRKLLGDVDPVELAKALNAWMQSQAKTTSCPTSYQSMAKSSRVTSRPLSHWSMRRTVAPGFKRLQEVMGKNRNLPQNSSTHSPKLRSKATPSVAMRSTQKESLARDRSGTRRRSARPTKGQPENYNRRSRTPIKPISSHLLYTAPEIGHGRVDIRGVGYIRVTLTTGQLSLHRIRRTNRSTIHREKKRQANARATHLPQ